MPEGVQKVGGPFEEGKESVSCPDCGVEQERTVLAQAYENSPTQYFIDEECPVCGFDDVWW